MKYSPSFRDYIPIAFEKHFTLSRTFFEDPR